MRTANDAARSIKRWVAQVLPEQWDVQLRREESMQRPSAVLVPVGPVFTEGSAYVRDMQREFQIYLWPEGKADDPNFGRQEAEELADTLLVALQQGAAGGRSMRLPVYDYSGVPWDQALPSGALPYDFLLVSDVQADARQDPQDDDLFTVTFKLRVRWHDDGDRSRYQKADGTLAHPVQWVQIEG